MNKIKFLFFCLLSFFALTACSSTNDESQNKEQDNLAIMTEDVKSSDSTKEGVVTDNENISRDNVTVVESELAFAFNYEEVERLIEDSELAVEGIVVSTENYVYIDKDTGQGEPFTKLSFKINKVLNGDSRLEGKEITVLEMGGYITAEQSGMGDKFPDLTEEELNETFFVIPDGHKPSIKGDEMVAFLTSETEGFETGFDFYTFIGVYQSKFEYNENSEEYVRPSEDFEELIEGAETKKERSIIEEEEQIEESINTEVTKLVEEAE
ncbi:hypothetical protein [Peribacillus simplex]|uniref:hypothetical protein n=1 Tax=Peribacillus simplex TaxID=1478 RepID=UPI0024C129D4|nr:hypothetical protein [Peribacillus simplex]WHY57956.1 hypothetical protein QNH43_06685 [Peribacillus simplex]